MLTAEDILARVHQRIFVPVRIVTSAGESYDLHHPDLIMVGQNYLIVGTASRENPAKFDRVSQVAIAHVTALEDLTMPSASAGNGSQ